MCKHQPTLGQRLVFARLFVTVFFSDQRIRYNCVIFISRGHSKVLYIFISDIVFVLCYFIGTNCLRIELVHLFSYGVNVNNFDAIMAERWPKVSRTSMCTNQSIALW